MARTSTYLKLRIDDVRLTGDAVRNLELIDALGANIYYRQERLTLRSAKDITILPNSEDLGGLGVGGSVSVGSADFPISSFSVHADELDLAGVDSFSLSSISLLSTGGGEVSISASPSTTEDYSLVLPEDDGAAGQVLSTDGSGTLSWADPEAGQAAAFTWTQADGATKEIVHGFGSTDIEVFVYSPDDNRQLMLDSIEYTNTNTITLAGAETPPASGYSVYLREIS